MCSPLSGRIAVPISTLKALKTPVAETFPTFLKLGLSLLEHGALCVEGQSCLAGRSHEERGLEAQLWLPFSPSLTLGKLSLISDPASFFCTGCSLHLLETSAQTLLL